jgi:hypothetical protein
MGVLFSNCSKQYNNDNDNDNVYFTGSLNDFLLKDNVALTNDHMFYSTNNHVEHDTNNNKLLIVLYNKINMLEKNTQENIMFLSEDIHNIYKELQDYKSNHQLSSK